MGQAFNKMLSITSREVKSFNLERRAEKIISRDKPTPAPMHPSTIKELERLKEENVSTEYLHKKDEPLDKFLKEVYVTSPDVAPPLERKINPDRPLPVKRSTDLGITYGYSESEEEAVPAGKVSLKQALTFISNHQNDPKKHSKAAIASQYKISLADTNDILDHFKMFSVKVQKKEVDPASLSAYERLQLKINKMSIYNANDVMKELNAINKRGKDKEEDSEKKEKEETSAIATRQVEKDAKPGGNHKKTEETSGTGMTVEVEKTQEKEELKRGENVQEEINSKSKEGINKGNTRKHSQENR